jgi:hypothetical protein
VTDSNPVELAEDVAVLTQRTAILKVISDFTKHAYDESRRKMAQVLNRGDRLVARSPLDGSKLGPVYMTDPKPECVITDKQALTDWVVENYPALTETGYEISGTDSEVIGVLFEHAPHLLRQVRRITADDMRELRAASITLGQPVGPGMELDIPGIEVKDIPGVVTCKPVDTAFQSVMDLYRAGRLALDGTVTPAIEEA